MLIVTNMAAVTSRAKDVVEDQNVLDWFGFLTDAKANV